jgi:GAF domain-containing protein
MSDDPKLRSLTSEGERPPPSPARDLSDLARRLDAEPDLAALLPQIVLAARDDIPGTGAAGITVHQSGHFESIAATEPLVRAVDQLQYDSNEGPCLSALREEATIRVDDMTQEARWPAFSRRAAEYGVGSMLSFQLYVHRGELGALNLYAPEPKAFDQESENIGLLFAAHAAIALAGAQSEANLRAAISTRDLIGQAKGILMERFKISGAQAFQLLVHRSQESHHKLRDVAEQLTETGEF